MHERIHSFFDVCDFTAKNSNTWQPFLLILKRWDLLNFSIAKAFDLGPKKCKHNNPKDVLRRETNQAHEDWFKTRPFDWKHTHFMLIFLKQFINLWLTRTAYEIGGRKKLFKVCQQIGNRSNGVYLYIHLASFQKKIPLQFCSLCIIQANKLFDLILKMIYLELISEVHNYSMN